MTLLMSLYTGDDWWSVSALAETRLRIALAAAKVAAPCLRGWAGLPEYVQDAARGVIADAVLRVVESRADVSSQTMGPFSVTTDTRPRSDRILSAADTMELRRLCGSLPGGRRSLRTVVGY